MSVTAAGQTQLRDRGMCVEECPSEFVLDESRTFCLECNGTCPKGKNLIINYDTVPKIALVLKFTLTLYILAECPGLTDAQVLDPTTINQFSGCTIITGNIRIGRVSGFKCVCRSNSMLYDMYTITPLSDQRHHLIVY